MGLVVDRNRRWVERVRRSVKRLIIIYKCKSVSELSVALLSSVLDIVSSIVQLMADHYLDSISIFIIHDY